MFISLLKKTYFWRIDQILFWMNVNHIIVAKYDPRKENNNLFQQKILFIFPIWRMRSNNADLVSLNQTICHWKKVLNKRIFRCLCVCVYIRIWTRKSVVEFEFITFSTFLEEKIQWLLSTKEINQCYNWKLQKYNICNIEWTSSIEQVEEHFP